VNFKQLIAFLAGRAGLPYPQLASKEEVAAYVQGCLSKDEIQT